jgi:hypothetical protein
MRMKMILGIVGGLTLLTGAVTLADPQDRPGIITQARVFVENRSRSDAVAVRLDDVTTDRPLRVQQMEGTVVRARLVSQPWEYRTITVRLGDDPSAALAPLGAEGWETTGLQLVANGVVAVVLKRPSQR